MDHSTLKLDKLYDKVGEKTYNMNSKDSRVGWFASHRMETAFVIGVVVVDNDDDENGLVQILVQLIHEYARLKSQ